MEQNDRIDMLFELVQQMRVETNRRFDRLEDNLMRRLDNYDDRNKLEERQAGLESTVTATQSYGKRINNLEKQHAHLQGKVAAWPGIVSAVITLIGRWITGQGDNRSVLFHEPKFPAEASEWEELYIVPLQDLHIATHQMLRYVGFRLTSHLPCCLHCEKSVKVARDWLDVCRKYNPAGY